MEVTVGQSVMSGLYRVIDTLPLGMGWLCVRNDGSGEVFFVSRQEVAEWEESIEADRHQQLMLFDLDMADAVV